MKSRQVVPLGVEPPAADEPSRPTRMHGIAMIGLVVSALTGLLATIALVTVSWPEAASRFMVAVVALSVLSFLGWASIAVFAAASSGLDTGEHGERGNS